MTPLEFWVHTPLVQSPLARTVTLALAHSLWEGVLIAVVLAAALCVAQSSRARYGAACAAMGFALGNRLLIIAGAVNASSGFILSVIMCNAMNRSFANVLFGAFWSRSMPNHPRRRRSRRNRCTAARPMSTTT